jgi:hypothetical protein
LCTTFRYQNKMLNFNNILLHFPPIDSTTNVKRKQENFDWSKWCQLTCSSNLMCFTNNLACLHLFVNIFIPLSSHTIYFYQTILFSFSKATIKCTEAQRHKDGMCLKGTTSKNKMCPILKWRIDYVCTKLWFMWLPKKIHIPMRL